MMDLVVLVMVGLKGCKGLFLLILIPCDNGKLNENFGLLYKCTAELLRNITGNIKSVVALLYKLTKYFGL